MNLACKNALLRRDVSHLIFPDEVQTLPAAEGVKAEGPEGRITPLEITPPEESMSKAIERLEGSTWIVGPVIRLSVIGRGRCS